jgi:hypothetical protein
MVYCTPFLSSSTATYLPVDRCGFLQHFSRTGHDLGFLVCPRLLCMQAHTHPLSFWIFGALSCTRVGGAQGGYCLPDTPRRVGKPGVPLKPKGQVPLRQSGCQHALLLGSLLGQVRCSASPVPLLHNFAASKHPGSSPVYSLMEPLVGCFDKPCS